jgi:tripartite-type tricarboxylate transporter receptor subunit TctC
MRGIKAALKLSLVSFAASANIALADPVEEFYRNKSIDMVIGYSPGGTYDLYARLVGRFLGDFIPGKPRVVIRNMPGGGSRVAAAYVYNVAPKNGTVIATGDQSLAVEQAMGDKSLTTDVNRLQYIGSPIIDNNVTVAWHTSGIRTIDDAKKQDVPTGATGGSTSSQYPKAMNSILGTKFKLVMGYPGGNDISLAMEKGEVMVRGSNSWNAWKSTRPDWVRDHKINILVQIGLSKAPDLPDVPLLMDLATNDEDRAVLKLLSSSGSIGRPLFVAPGVPPERVAALRDAFDRMVKSSIFLEAAAAQQFEINAVSGEELQRIVGDIVATPKPIADRLNQIIGGIEQNTR